jgi:hypothetical protein
MKTQILTLLLLISSNIIAKDYELISFVQSRVRTPDEILKETEKSREELTSYTCDSSNRFDLFTPRLVENKNADSLKLQDQEKKIYIYKNKKLYLNGKLVRKVKGKFLRKAYNTLLRLENIPEAQQLISELQHSIYEFTIIFGGNRYDPSPVGGRSYLHGNNAGFISMMDDLRPMIERLSFNQIGYGGRIYFNPNIDASFVEVDYLERKVNPDVVLAHEMYHAYDAMRGLLDRRFIKATHLEFQPVCEYRAVRLENILRARLGGKFRRFYSKPSDLSSVQDMLDDNDEPVVIPTPCIDWL